ncbi:SAM-dependent methyltransferase [Micromonospora zamorensis]|uniref:SAM-dependent methyltransferase n=1 Tax=Micromonospora zamorensis TaxID=709883 RepID=UPI0033F1C20C
MGRRAGTGPRGPTPSTYPGRRTRDRAEFARFFTGLELAEPGIVPVTEWRPQVPPEQRPALADASIYGAVARKP